MDVKAASRRRAYSTTQISDHEPRRKVPTASDPGTALVKNPLRKTQLQDLQQVSPEPWQVDVQVGDPPGGLCLQVEARKEKQVDKSLKGRA